MLVVIVPFVAVYWAVSWLLDRVGRTE